MGKGRLSGRTSLLISFVAAGGAVSIIGAVLAFPPDLTQEMLRRSLILLVITAAAEFVSIRLKHGDSNELLTLFELAVVADMVLLPPSLALLVSLGGLALALLVQRRPLIKFAFNLGQYAVGVMPAVAIYHGFGHGDFTSNEGLIAMLGGMAVFTAINLVTISAIIAATTDRRLMDVIAEERGLSFAMGLGNSAVGMVAISLWLERPALMPAVLAPAFALHVSFRGWVKQKELSQQMREETEKLSRILEHSSEGIVLADADGTVLLWSPSMEAATGVSGPEAIGKSLSYLLRGRNSYGQPTVVDVSQKAEPVDLEIIATDGTARWLRVQHGPGFDERGAMSFDVLVVTDVTRQREVDRLKDDFFSTVSHELRTPLTPIKGYASLLLRKGDMLDAERRNGALNTIVERADHMARLVEDMLLASRMAGDSERRLPEVDRKPVDVGAVTEKVMRSFRADNPTREFDLHIDEDTIATGETMRVEQILAHLVSNAVKFSAEGSPIDVSVQREGSEIRLRVRDEGRGIPADKHEEVFQKFKRVEDPLVMETGGAGLGLFIVRQLAVAMGGSATVESKLGEGSTFTVALPVNSPASMMPQPFSRRIADAG
jgi:PAS domain S-box-containing protein